LSKVGYKANIQFILDATLGKTTEIYIRPVPLSV
jgi:hypothetical protein